MPTNLLAYRRKAAARSALDGTFTVKPNIVLDYLSDIAGRPVRLDEMFYLSKGELRPQIVADAAG